jgi:hypothetical protein
LVVDGKILHVSNGGFSRIGLFRSQRFGKSLFFLGALFFGSVVNMGKAWSETEGIQ